MTRGAALPASAGRVAEKRLNMGLVYKRSDGETARKYERSRGMEANPGVSHLAVVSNGRKRGVSDNPYQWIEGRGMRHRHVSPSYEKLRGAASWGKRHQATKARLYPVDEHGSVLTRPISKRRQEMAYNIEGLRRAMRSNPGHGVAQVASGGGVTLRSNARRRRRRTSIANRTVRSNRRRSRAGSKKMLSNRRRSRRSRRVVSNRRRSRRSRRVVSNRRRSRRSRRPRANRRRSRRSPRRVLSNRRRSRRPRRLRFNKTSRASAGPVMVRPSPIPAAFLVAPAKPKRRRRRASRVSTLLHQAMLSGGGPVYRTRTSRRGVPRTGVLFPYRAHDSRYHTEFPKGKRGRARARRASRAWSRMYGGKRLAANRRHSRRRGSRRRMSANRRGSRRSRRGLRPNLLTTHAAKRRKDGSGQPVGRRFQILSYGPRSFTRASKTGKRGRVLGYPVYIPAHVISRGAVRRYRGIGGAAKDKHLAAKTGGYAERKKYKRSRRAAVTPNRRTSMRSNRRRSRRSRRNPKYVMMNPRYVVANERGRYRRLRRNAVDWMKDVLTPIAGGTVGFVGARVISNGLANIEGLRNILDSGRSAADAENTKIAANLIGIAATLGLSAKVDLIRRHRGALVTGMGLALADRFLTKIGGDAQQYLGGLGEYVTQPLGEYVTQPLGEYVNQPVNGLGAYVNDPSAGLGADRTLYAAAGLGTLYAAAGMGRYHEGIDPANQATIDGLMDTMENPVRQAAAGMGAVRQAAAGMGRTYYANAGIGDDGPGYESIQTPTDVARTVETEMPYTQDVSEQIVTPEGQGYAGGIFARNLFAGMV